MNTTNRRNFIKGMFALAVAPFVPMPKLPMSIGNIHVPVDVPVPMRAIRVGMVRGNFAELLAPGIHATFLHFLEEEKRCPQRLEKVFSSSSEE